MSKLYYGPTSAPATRRLDLNDFCAPAERTPQLLGPCVPGLASASHVPHDDRSNRSGGSGEAQALAAFPFGAGADLDSE